MLLTVLGCSAPAPAGPSTASAAGTEFFVDPQTPAAVQVRQWAEQGRSGDADQIRKIADQPVPLWVSGDVAEVGSEVRAFVDRAERAGQRPLLVAYNVPHRDCGSFSGGGAPDGGYYRNWISQIAQGLGGRPATVILEPDAVPHELSGCVDGSLREERYELLSDAIGELKAAGPVAVYLDAGNPAFITDVGKLSDGLRRSGIAQADGFSLNVANFRTTRENIDFGTRISEQVGGKHFVIDTSRNGNGPPPSGDVDGVPSFCNPPGRALGQPPTTQTESALVDAYLWIKRPGESDGDCRGGPPAGQWWPEYALGLAEGDS